jgi:hypothetical protein
MSKTFIKDGVIRTFTVKNGKVLTSITIDGFMIFNPTLEVFMNEGWEEYVAPEPEPYLPTVEELVEGKIRERYSINQEFEVQRKRDVEPEAFQEYYNFVEEAITWAKNQPHRDE